MTKKGQKTDWPALNHSILASTDIEKTAADWGVQFSNEHASPSGWRACHAVDREDKNPSAAICIDSKCPQYGMYTDHGSDEQAISFFELGSRVGKHQDWQTCREDLARQAGVEIPTTSKKSSERQSQPSETLLDTIKEQLDIDGRPGEEVTKSYASKFAKARPGITTDAVLAAGGHAGSWARNASQLLIFFAFSPNNWKSPRGVLLYRADGKAFPKSGRLKERKSHLLRHSKDGLIPIGGETVFVRAETAWLCEGLPDTLALHPHLPDKHVAVTTTHGAGSFDHHLAQGFKGKNVNIVMDRDRAGVEGAKKRATALMPTRFGVKEIRIVDLPYPIAANHGKDLRDFLCVGNGFKELQKLAEAACVENHRIDVEITTDEFEVNEAANLALARDNRVFQRGGNLVQILKHKRRSADSDPDPIHPSIHILDEAVLRDWLTKNARFFKRVETTDAAGQPSVEESPKHPPQWCVKAVAAQRYWPRIRILEGIAPFPLLRGDGSLLSNPGYDPLTRMFLTDDIPSLQVPDAPTKADAVKAITLLLNLVDDFPFERPEHAVAWLAFLLTPLARYAFDGPSPLFLIDSNVRGSGKSLLADLASVIILGRTVARMSNPRDDDEARKRITALALKGDPLVLIDNIVGGLGSSALDAALTGTTWQDRILGKSEIVTLPLKVTWAATGNNVVLLADSCRRILHIRLQSPHEAPERRKDFKHKNILAYAREQRSELLSAALTILRAYFIAGCPEQGLPAWGSFESWGALIRNALVWAGQPDPAETRQELLESGDRELLGIRALIENWDSADPNHGGLTTREIREILEKGEDVHTAFSEAICELCPPQGTAPLPTARQIGNKLKHIKKRVVGGKCLDNREGAQRMRKWFVTEMSIKSQMQETDQPAETPAAIEGDSGDCGDCVTSVCETEDLMENNVNNSNSTAGVEKSHQSHQSHQTPSAPPTLPNGTGFDGKMTEVVI